ncbi:MAG: TIGR02996 domain-containing protein [Myxococcales bacterium]|nr:TIGR02996 domain-containing protein [Myxococcales bacterium]
MSSDAAGSPVVTTLRAALTALDSGDRGLAVAHLAEVWSATRDPDVARIVVGQCGAEVDLPRGPPEAREERWATVWGANPLARSALAKVPWPSVWRLALLRVEAMAKHPDPRVGDVLLGLEGHCQSSTAFPLWRRVARVLGDQGGVPHMTFARGLEHRVPAGPPSYRALLANGPPAAVELEPEASALVATLDRRLGRPRGGPDLAPLLAEVYAHPDDDDVRLVYADALAAEGDPRGEFIQLQVASAERSSRGLPASTPVEQRISALLRQHGEGWVEGTGVGLLKEGRVFQRGFLVAGIWNDVGDSVPHPAWRLVEEVRVGRGRSSPLSAIFRAALPRLQRLYGVDHIRLPDLLATRYPEQLTHLGYVPAADALPPPHRFPAVTELHVGLVVHWLGPFPGGTVMSLRTLRAWEKVQRWVLHHHQYGLRLQETWCAPPQVTSVVHCHWNGRFGAPEGWVTTLKRPDDGAMRFVHIRWGGGSHRTLNELASILSEMPEVESLTVEVPVGMNEQAAAAARRETRRRHGHWIAPPTGLTGARAPRLIPT